MSQHDYIIDNQLAPAFRADLNAALGAIVTQNSGISAPSTTYANMLWYDTTNDLLKIRNEANSAWITMGTVDQTNSVFNPNFLPATQAEAEAGTNNTKDMTPLRVAQAIAVLSPAFASGVNIQTFTASGTYTPTSGYKWGLAFVTGGGGGGNSGTGGVGGGGGGGTSIGVLNLSTIGTPSVTIGAGGTANNSGGTTTVSTLSASGGSGGNSSSGGFGGSGSGGALNITGGTGGIVSGTSQDGSGGGSFWGAGLSAAVYGAGGKGTSAGKSGVVMIVEFK